MKRVFSIFALAALVATAACAGDDAAEDDLGVDTGAVAPVGEPLPPVTPLPGDTMMGDTMMADTMVPDTTVM